MKTNIGIIGLGVIAKTFANAVKLVNNAEIVAGASRSIENAKKFCDEFSIKKAYGSYEELLKDEEVQAVYIATVNSTHYDIIKLCLNSGKAVLCEKPFILTKEECTELYALAKDKKLLLMEAMKTRFLPTINKAHEWINEGKIGELKLIEANYGFGSVPNANSRLFNKSLGGGAMYDVGVYTIAFALDFAKSKIKDVSVNSYFDEFGVDEYDAINIKFYNNVIASLKTAITVSMKNDGFLYGEKGYIHLKSFFGSNKVTLFDKQGNILDSLQNDDNDNVPVFRYQIEHFSNLFLNGEIVSPKITMQDNLECIKVFEEMRKEQA